MDLAIGKLAQWIGKISFVSALMNHQEEIKKYQWHLGRCQNMNIVKLLTSIPEKEQDEFFGIFFKSTEVFSEEWLHKALCCMWLYHKYFAKTLKKVGDMNELHEGMTLFEGLRWVLVDPLAETMGMTLMWAFVSAVTLGNNELCV